VSAMFTVGQLVVSTAGRDTGELYVVVGQLSPTMVLVADGRRRKLANPKRKNIRHLRPLRTSATTVNSYSIVSDRLTDATIRQIINQFVQDNIKAGEEGHSHV